MQVSLTLNCEFIKVTPKDDNLCNNFLVCMRLNNYKFCAVFHALEKYEYCPKSPYYKGKHLIYVEFRFLKDKRIMNGMTKPIKNITCTMPLQDPSQLVLAIITLTHVQIAKSDF